MTRDGTLVTIDGRPALRFERRYRHPMERVWRAITDPGEMAVWFPSDVEGDRAVGAELTFGDEAQFEQADQRSTGGSGERDRRPLPPCGGPLHRAAQRGARRRLGAPGPDEQTRLIAFTGRQP